MQHFYRFSLMEARTLGYSNNAMSTETPGSLMLLAKKYRTSTGHLVTIDELKKEMLLRKIKGVTMGVC